VAACLGPSVTHSLHLWRSAADVTRQGPSHTVLSNFANRALDACRTVTVGLMAPSRRIEVGYAWVALGCLQHMTYLFILSVACPARVCLSQKDIYLLINPVSLRKG
jgi:hypothetical protein